MDRVPPTLNRIPLRLPVLLLTAALLLLAAPPALADHDANPDPGNDVFADEIFLNTLNEGFTNAGAGVDPGEYTDCEGSPVDHIVNFYFDVGERGEIIITAQGSSEEYPGTTLDTVISLLRPDGSRIACNDDGAGIVGSSRIPRTVLDPGRYFLEVGGYDHAPPDNGPFSVSLNFTPGTDQDEDGSRTPADCDDGNPGIKPGATDVPYNGVDEDCSGTPDNDATTTASTAGRTATTTIRVFVPARARSRVTSRTRTATGAAPRPGSGRAEHRASEGRVREPCSCARARGHAGQAGLRMVVRCRGGGCPRTQSRTARSSRPVSFRAYRGRTLRRGAVVTVFVYRPRSNFIGEFFRFQVRSGTVRRSEGCLRPGTARRGRCSG